MRTVDQIEAIRRAYFIEEKSVRAIARDLRHSRRVIREAIAGDHPQPPRYQLQAPKPRPALDPAVPLIDAWLTADQTAPRKQRHTAKRIFDRLVVEHSYTGCERIVRQYVHDWKRQHAGPSGSGGSFLPLAYAPGAEAQCDWGEAQVRIAGVEQTAHLFCLRLAYSLKPVVYALPTERQECFLAGHLHAFQVLGGVPHRITYDNLGSAVTKVLTGRSRQEHEQFIAFRSHSLFDSHFTLPGRDGAHEKPLVESLVGYARRYFRVPVLDVASWDALNTHLAERCAAEDARTTPGRDRPIGRRWQEERAQLRPLPGHAFACCRTVAVKASRQALVTFERNRYSVPTRHAGERLVLRAFPWHVELSAGHTVVARHPRLYGRDGEQFDPLHYLHVLEHKPGAFELTRPHPEGTRRWRTSWPPVYEQYLTALRQARPAEATREFVRVLQLHARHASEQIAAALTRALQLQCWSAEAVELLVRQASEPSPPMVTLDLRASRTLAPLAAVTIPLPDLSAFDRLLPLVTAERAR